MSTLKKVLALIIGVPVLFFGSAFVYGMYLGVTDQIEPKAPEPNVAESVPTTAPVEESPTKAAAPAEVLVVPDSLDATSATAWLQDTRFFFLEGADVRCDTARLALLTVGDAHKIYAALRSGGK